jgi:hypothetical protein
MSVQVSSRARDPWISAGRSDSDRRRYLIAKKTSASETATVKNTVTATMKKKSASTSPA